MPPMKGLKLDVEELNLKYGGYFYGSGIDISGEKIKKVDL